jgi:hypothetical protein
MDPAGFESETTLWEISGGNATRQTQVEPHSTCTLCCSIVISDISRHVHNNLMDVCWVRPQNANEEQMSSSAAWMLESLPRPIIFTLPRITAFIGVKKPRAAGRMMDT